ncbi:MAG: hypothetical protein MH252_08520 [Thermosynechococcaceae cyanobacterium MS004]|nr:hypothetical protein [Thermosynechococcaceae cyanobacterium MS004]
MFKSPEISKFTGVPERTIREWQKQGVIQESQDISEIVRAIIKFLRDKPTPKKQVAFEDELYAEKIRLTQAQADKLELEIAEKAGELVAVDQVLQVWGQAIGVCRSRLLSIPPRLAVDLSSVTDPRQCQKLLYEAICEATDELADGKLFTR